MKKFIVLLGEVLVSIKGVFTVNESPTSKSKSIRGRITSILTDLKEANFELEGERLSTISQFSEEKKDINVNISSLYDSISVLRDEVEGKRLSTQVKVEEFENEEKANSALLRGIESLING